MYGKFLVEGHKTVIELISSSFIVDKIYATSDWDNANAHQRKIEIETVTEDELQKISTLENPQQAIAIASIPAITSDLTLKEGKYIALDTLNDPGNAGTIIRTAEWFGFDGVILSENSVDIYNPKVVNAAKGSLFRIPVFYQNLADCFTKHSQMPVLGTFMEGESVYTASLPTSGILLIGNEANGIDPSLWPMIKNKLSIPKVGKAESLNAGIAAGILMNEWVRRNNQNN
ncbi:MAG: RNA methyltransferase [Chitinophagales bacterium]|nr:RNA methyltransferase [Chitinophagales bacterium]